MISTSHINALVAEYLESKGYKSTLTAFEQETNHKYNKLASDESLESIVSDRINFKKLSSHLAIGADKDNDINVNISDSFTHSDKIKSRNITLPNWTLKCPNSCEFIDLGTLSSLIIHASFFKANVNHKIYDLALFVTNTRYLFVFDINVNQILLSSYDVLNGQPIKIVQGIASTNHMIMCDMNGNLKAMHLAVDNDDNWFLHNSLPENVANLKLHRRLITDFKYLPISDTKDLSILGYFTSTGWDSRMTIGCIRQNKDNINHLDISLIGDYKLFTNPTSLLITLDKETNLPVVLVGRLESTLLTIFTITSHSKEDSKVVEIAKLSMNDSEFSSHSFQPMSTIEITSSNEDKIITVATDHVPYMRLITLVLPPLKEILSLNESSLTVSSQLSKIASQNIDNTESFQSKTPILRSYIISNFNSLSPQDKYSNAIILSRPNCSGIWIPGDDGKLRGFDLRTGNVFETLKSNDGRAKTAFIGNCKNDSEVIVVCGAVDKKISVWKCL